VTPDSPRRVPIPRMNRIPTEKTRKALNRELLLLQRGRHILKSKRSSHPIQCAFSSAARWACRCSVFFLVARSIASVPVDSQYTILTEPCTAVVQEIMAEKDTASLQCVTPSGMDYDISTFCRAIQRRDSSRHPCQYTN
jgi:hypothetical protein